MSTLTDMEGCVLGIIWARGACTPYAVRAELLRSPSVHWSGSAGAIYPLMRRLERKRIVRARRVGDSQRAAQQYSVTASGLRELIAWVDGPLEDWILAPPMDPLRTRMRFLAAIPRERQVALVNEVLEKLAPLLETAKEYCSARKQAGDDYDYWMGLGALHAVRARIDWLIEVRSDLELRETVSEAG